MGAPTGITGNTPSLPVVPVVLSSEVRANFPDRITVTWDRPMEKTGNIKPAIDIIIDGGQPVHATSISLPDNTMIIHIAPAFTAGQVISWAYNPATSPGHPILREVAVPNTEAENQTYAVTNNVVAVVTP